MAALDAKLAKLLAAANGARRKLVLAASDVEAAIAEAASAPHGIAVRHGGAQPLGKTTLVLAVRPPKRATVVVVGIATCWADRPTPGRAWKELGPWQQDFSRDAAKAHAWAAAKGADRVTVPAAKGAAKPKPAGDGAALLAEILAHPDDDHARAVYADHLTEVGDPRGELITAQLALATAKKPAVKAALGKQIAALLRKHGAGWQRAAMQDAKACEMRRGFVACVKMTGTAWGAKGARLYATDPVEELVVSQPNAPGLAAIAAADHTRRLRTLTFSSPYWVERDRDADALAAFLASPALGAIPHLDLAINHAAGALPATFWTSLPAHRAVRTLRLRMHPKPRTADLARVFPAATIKLR